MSGKSSVKKKKKNRRNGQKVAALENKLTEIKNNKVLRLKIDSKYQE